MQKAVKVCRICGREYEPCGCARKRDGIFRWQMVACCEEHGRQYLEKVLAARAREAEQTAGRAQDAAEISK